MSTVVNICTTSYYVAQDCIVVTICTTSYYVVQDCTVVTICTTSYYVAQDCTVVTIYTTSYCVVQDCRNWIIKHPIDELQKGTAPWPLTLSSRRTIQTLPTSGIYVGVKEDRCEKAGRWNVREQNCPFGTHRASIIGGTWQSGRSTTRPLFPWPCLTFSSLMTYIYIVPHR